jgi:hypothetical protein
MYWVATFFKRKTVFREYLILGSFCQKVMPIVYFLNQKTDLLSSRFNLLGLLASYFHILTIAI